MKDGDGFAYHVHEGLNSTFLFSVFLTWAAAISDPCSGRIP